jgi:hypothetical protein
MKRWAAILLVASLSACTMGKTGSRGPQITRTASEPSPHDDSTAERERQLGQR